MTKNQLPVPIEGSVLNFKNPEEYDAAIKAATLLARIVADHIQEALDATQEDNTNVTPDADDQFLYGQSFDREAEVWELPESWFDDEGIFGPSDL